MTDESMAAEDPPPSAGPEDASEQLRDLLDNSTDMIVSVGGDGRILYVNKALLAALGYARGEMIGQPAVEFVAPDFRKAYLAAGEIVWTQGELRGFEADLLTREGGRVPTCGSANSRVEDGRRRWVRVTFRDVTTERQTQNALRLMEQVTRTLAGAVDLDEALRDTLEQMARFGRWDYGDVWLFSDTGVLERAAVVCGPGFESFMRAGTAPGVGPAEAIPDPDAEPLWIPDIRAHPDLPRARAALQAGLRAKLLLPIAAGTERLGLLAFLAARAGTAEDHGVAVLASAARLLGPIVKRRKSDRLLLETQGGLSDLANQVNHLLMIVGPDGCITFANRSWKAALGYSDEEISRLSVEDVLHPEEREAWGNMFPQVMGGGAVADVATRLIARDGHVVAVEGGALCRLENGRPVAMRVFFRDVTESRRAEEALQENRDRLRALVDGAADGILTVDGQGRIDSANPAAERMFGYTAEEMVGREAEQLIPASYPGSRPPRLGGDARFPGRRVHAMREMAAVRRDGSRFTVELSISEAASAERPFLTLIVRDVTQRLKDEANLRRDAKMLDLANEAIIVFALPELTVSYWNAGAERLYGWTREEALGQGMALLLRGGDHGPVAEINGTVIREGRWTGELHHTRKDGQELVVESRLTLLEETGAPSAVLAINADVSARRRAEVLFGAVLRATTENAIIASDAQGTITAFNAGAERMLGYPADEVVGLRGPESFLDPEELARWAARLGMEPTFQTLMASARAGTPETREWTLIRRDGSRVPVSVNVTALRDDRSRVTGFIGIATDVTDRKRVEQALLMARDAAESAARSRSEFLANMSHEIRTPMNGVIGMTELLLDTELSREQREYMEMVRGSAEALLVILNDILDFSRIEAGKLALDPHPFLLRDAFGDTLKTLAVRAREKRLELAYRVDPLVPDRLVGDLGRLRQVLVNLVSNAIKFTEAGEVVVDVALETETAERVRLHISVRDTGIGIPAERRAAIFEAFTQADASTTRRFGGTGLGLTISAQLVSLMNGRISVESEPGRGSTFHVVVSLSRDLEEAGDAPVPGSSPLDRLVGCRALVVDDNQTNRRILEEMLRNWDMRATAVDGAAAALAALRAAAEAGTPYVVVLLDALMPDMDGFELAGAIRSDPVISGAIIMMLSSAADPADAARCRDLGLARYLTKPIKQSDLFDAIATVLSGREPAAAPIRALRPVAQAGRQLRVLVAEDNEVNQIVAQAFLEKAGHAVTLAGNGLEAIRLLEAGDFDVVLMDVQMPELGGLEATGRIRERERGTGHHIPIVALTAHAMKGDRERCLAAGVDAYLAKPLREPELFRTLDQLVPPHTAPTDASAAAPEQANALANARLLEAVGGDEALLRKLAKRHLAGATAMLGELSAAVATGDGAAIRRVAHRLKGSVGVFGAAAAAEAASRLEQLAATGKLDGTAEALAAFEAAHADLEAKLRAVLG